MNTLPKASKRLARRILTLMKREYPAVSCTLDHLSPIQLAIATILSAQCTDKRVNMVTPDLFRRFPTVEDFARAPVADIEEMIRSTGFYHNKARNIQNLCRSLIEKYDGELPADMDTLVALPGIGRKTANVILGNAFGLSPGFVVDTHVFRLSRRLGLSMGKTPEKVEADLMLLFPQQEWIDTSHRFIMLGRGPCNARKPNCSQCFLNSVCPKIL